MIRRSWLALSPALRRSVVNSSWLSGGQLLVAAAAAGTLLLIIRVLGPADAGRLTVALSVVALFVPVVQMGMGQLLLRELGPQRGEGSATLGTAWGLQSIGGLAALIGTWIVAWWWIDLDRMTALLIVVAGLGLPFRSTQAVASWFDARVASSHVVLGRLAAVGLATIGRLAALLVLAPLWVFAALAAVEPALEAVAWLRQYRRHGSPLTHLRFRLERARELLRDAWPYFLAGVGVLVYLRVDQLMLAGMRGEADAGWYAAAVGVTDLFLLVPVALARSVTPGLLELRTINYDLYQRRMQQFYDGLTWIAILIAAGLSLSAGWLVPMLFGQAFAPAGLSLAVLAWTLPITCQGVGSGPWVLAENCQRARAAGLVTAAFTNIVLNYWWIPDYGGPGAAAASLISYAAAVYLPGVVFRSMRPCLGQLLLAYLAPWRGLIRLVGHRERT